MAKYYTDVTGKYVGSFDGVWVQDPADEQGDLPPQRWVFPEVPVGAIEVASPPSDSRQVYSNGAWQPVVPAVITAEDQARLNAALVEEGSVVRALGLVLLNTMNAQNIVTMNAVNELRTKASLPAYTVAQFKAALSAQQGVPFYTMAEFLAALQAKMR
jgi:hypothetical protein